MGKELCLLCERYTKQASCRMGLIDSVKCTQSEYSAFWPKPETSVQDVKDLVSPQAMETIISNSRRHGMEVIDGKFYDFRARP